MSEFNNERMGILLDMLGKEQATVRNKCGTVFGISTMEQCCYQTTIDI